MLQQLVQDVITAEFSEEIEAARYARSPERRDVRHGYRSRRFTTRVGSLEVRIPQDRGGEFQPSLCARYQRSEQALVAARPVSRSIVIASRNPVTQWQPPILRTPLPRN